MSPIKTIEATDAADEVMTAPMAAAVKGVHRNSVHKAIKEGRLKASRSGKTWLIRRRDLDAWQVIGHRPKGLTNGVERPGEVSPGTALDRRERGRKLRELLDQWMADESGHDEEMWPKLKAVLEQDRISSRPLFKDESSQ